MLKRDKQLAKQIGSRISLERKKLGLTQEQASERAGLSQQFWACVERGQKGLSAESIIKICTALNISTDYLLMGVIGSKEMAHLYNLLKPMTELQWTATENIIKNILIACGYQLSQSKE